MRRDLLHISTFSASTQRSQHLPKSGMVIQKLEECGLGQRSSSTLPSQTRRLSKRFRLTSPAPSPAIDLGDSTPYRLDSIPSQTPRFIKWFRLR